MKKIPILMIPLFAMGLFADTALGQAPDSGTAVSETRPVNVRSAGRGRRGRGMERMQDRLGLSDEQAKEVRGILREARKKSIKLRADLRVARIELGELVTQEKVDQDKISAKLDEIGKLSQRRLRLRTDTVLTTRNVLSPEQIKKADRWFRRSLSGSRGRGRYRKR